MFPIMSANFIDTVVDGDTPLTLACSLHGDGKDPKMDRKEIIEMLLRYGANPLIADKNGKYALDLCPDDSLNPLIAAYTLIALCNSDDPNDELKTRCESILSLVAIDQGTIDTPLSSENM